MRAVPPIAVALLVLSLAAPASASVDKDLAAARRKATRAAEQLSRAEAQLGRVENEMARVTAKAKSTQAQLTRLEGAVRESVLRQYVSGGIEAPLLFSANIDESVRARELARFVTVGATNTVARYRALRDDLAEASAALRTQRDQRRRALQDLRLRRAQARAEVERLGRVQRELEAKAAAARARQASARTARGAAATVSRGGATSRVTFIPVSGPWACPVAGPRAFTNDYGDPRSGGRRHQGIDILAPRGTPVVASVGGVARQHHSSLGGLSYYLHGDDGNTYFGTHLASYGASGRVRAGTVVGTVGNSGNASGGPPHLHFEIHPGGGGPVNPYPTLVRYC